MGTNLRLQSIPHIIDEIEEAIQCGARHIDFEDDNMNWDKARMLELMNALATRFQSGAGSLACESGQGSPTSKQNLNLACEPTPSPLPTPESSLSNISAPSNSSDPQNPQSQTTKTTRTTRPTRTESPDLNFELRTSNPALIKFSARNGLVAEKLDAQIFRRMADAGFDRVNLAVVSGSPSLQKDLDRNQPIARFEETIHLAHAAGLKVTAYLILGLPTDTIDEMIRNILWLAHLPVEIGPSIFYPVPGTPLFDLCVRKAYIDPANKPAFRSSAYPVETENFSRNDLVTLMRACRILNYLKNDEALSPLSLQHSLNAAEGLLSHAATQSLQALEKTNAARAPRTGVLRQLTTTYRLDRQTIGSYLIHRFLETGNLLGLRYRKRRKPPFMYEEIDYAASNKVTEPIHQALQELANKDGHPCC